MKNKFAAFLLLSLLAIFLGFAGTGFGMKAMNAQDDFTVVVGVFAIILTWMALIKFLVWLWTDKF